MGSQLRENAIQTALAAERDRQGLALTDGQGMPPERGPADGMMPR
jgi:miniconductance mechanosensitive channel